MIKPLLRAVVPPVLLHACRRVWKVTANDAQKERDHEERVLQRLASMDRLISTTAVLRGSSWSITDGLSFSDMYREHFIHERFRFATENPRPLFLDCGANIGVVTRYLKCKYPHARIIAFEPDESCFTALQENCKDLDDVTCQKAAVWIREESLDFDAVGATGGHLNLLNPNPSACSKTTVAGVRLRDFLNEPVEFLKLDIEGAEIDVLVDCADRLINVKRMFVEYHSFANHPQRMREFFTILEEAGFRVHAHAPKDARQPFSELPIYNNKDFRLNLFCQRDA